MIRIVVPLGKISTFLAMLFSTLSEMLKNTEEET